MSYRSEPNRRIQPDFSSQKRPHIAVIYAIIMRKLNNGCPIQGSPYEPRTALSTIDPAPARTPRPFSGSSFARKRKGTHDHGPRRSNQADKSRELLRLRIPL